MKRFGNTIIIFLLLLAMVIWGGTWTSAKLIANMAEPEVLIFWRFLITVLSSIPIMFLFKKSFTLNKASIKQVLLGAFFLFVYNKFFFWGLQNGLAGAGGVLVTTLNPIFVFILAVLILRKKAAPLQILGLFLGLTGGSILLEIWSINLSKLFASGNAFFILACTGWAFLTITSEKSKGSLSPIVFSFYVYCVVTVLDFFIALPYQPFKVFELGSVFWWNILYMSILATTFATTIFFAASGRLGSEKAAAFIFTVPFSAVLISWWILGETPRLCTIAGGLISLTAVYLINTKAKSHPQAEISSQTL
jgi:drug/metabolite transporter (DMT)-like permease